MLLKPAERHSWDLSPSEAVQLQKRLAPKIKLKPLSGRKRLRFLAGVDMSFPEKRRGLAAVVVFDAQSREVIEERSAEGPVVMPYVPGLLSFRECPLALEALEEVTSPVDVIMVDGQGIAHPRRLGFAAHVGLWAGLPTIGCAKSILCGGPEEPPGREAGSFTRLMDKDEQIGVVYRTRTDVKPVYLSPGNLVDFEGLLRVMETFPEKYRLPEPVRLAHILASRLR